ncbi:hypothetical protein ACFXKF_32695 [Streptomyces scopuliridis]|uniref:hypothetical protein n=1 Tax=Streptomyces scopuliridis TaxID=452529 RepID=UPI0036BE8AF8
MSERVDVYLDREALAGSLLSLLLPGDGAARSVVEATATEINGEPANPATLQRVYREVDERLAAGRKDGDEDSVMDQLMELFGDDWTVESEGPGKLTAEQADVQADRAVAHRIITELAKAYPLPPDQWSDLAVAE